MRGRIDGGIWEMKNILFLGSSHVGALKAGFHSLTSKEGIDACPHLCKVNFAGFKGRLLDEFYLNSNLDLVSNNRNNFKSVIHDLKLDKKQNCIPLGEFDLIAIVQGPSPFYPFLYCGDNIKISILSSFMIKSICDSLLISDYNCRLSGKWNEFDRFTYISPCITEILKSQELKTIYIGTPVPSRKCLSNVGRNLLVQDDINIQKWNTIFNQVWSICESMNSHDNEFSTKWYLPCSEIIDQNQIYTSNNFFESAVNVSGENRFSDGWHANAEYGRILILDFLKMVTTFSY